MLLISPTYKQNQHITETKSQMYSKSTETTETVTIQQCWIISNMTVNIKHNKHAVPTTTSLAAMTSTGMIEHYNQQTNEWHVMRRLTLHAELVIHVQANSDTTQNKSNDCLSHSFLLKIITQSKFEFLWWPSDLSCFRNVAPVPHISFLHHYIYPTAGSFSADNFPVNQSISRSRV